MRKSIVILLGFLCGVGSLAAQNSQEILKELSQNISHLGAYSVDFVMSSTEGEANGSYMVNGEKFRIATGAIELLYDGSTVYEIDHTVKEIALDNMGENYTFWSNPAQAFAMLDSRYEHLFDGYTESQGKHLYRIKLSAKNKGDEDFVLLIDSTSKLPFKAIYGQGNHSVSIRFVRIKTTEQPNEALFKFDSSKYSEYELIELRN
jgi:outer membrane lipoprotein-sorting protein